MASTGISSRLRWLHHHHREGPTMFRLTRFPIHVSNWLQVLRPMFRHRHPSMSPSGSIARRFIGRR
jgi:hypothetical protein